MAGAPEDRSRPRVLLLGAFPPQAQGIPGYCGALARSLAARVTVDAAGFRAMYPRWLFPGVKKTFDPTSVMPVADGLTVRHPLAWYNPVGWCWLAWRTPADVVHIQWWSLPLFPVWLTIVGIARWRRIPVVVTAHNVLPHEPSPWFLRASGMLYRRAAHVVVHSETNRKQLLDTFHLGASRVSDIPMGIEPPLPSRPDPSAARKQLDLPPDRPVLLFFGTIRPYKGLDVFLRALATVREAYPDVLLLVAGQPWEPWAPYGERIEELNLAGHVDCRLGYVAECDVPTLFAAADLVVLPYTHFDAQSAVAVQAIGHGRPVLVTETGGLPDLVGRDPRWCVPPSDVGALADALMGFLADPKQAETAFEQHRKTLEETTSWTAGADRHLAIYRAVCTPD